jgi:hypothetical protein
MAASTCFSGAQDVAGVKTLIMSQNDDGSWPAGAIYHSPQTEQLCCHQGLTTTWAIQALQLQAELSQSKKSFSKHEPEGTYAVSWPSSSFLPFFNIMRRMFSFWH